MGHTKLFTYVCMHVLIHCNTLNEVCRKMRADQVLIKKKWILRRGSIRVSLSEVNKGGSLVGSYASRQHECYCLFYIHHALFIFKINCLFKAYVSTCLQAKATSLWSHYLIIIWFLVFPDYLIGHVNSIKRYASLDNQLTHVHIVSACTSINGLKHENGGFLAHLLSTEHANAPYSLSYY